jgi:hypothetical protein
MPHCDSTISPTFVAERARDARRRSKRLSPRLRRGASDRFARATQTGAVDACPRGVAQGSHAPVFGRARMARWPAEWQRLYPSFTKRSTASRPCASLRVTTKSGSVAMARWSSWIQAALVLAPRIGQRCGPEEAPRCVPPCIDIDASFEAAHFDGFFCVRVHSQPRAGALGVQLVVCEGGAEKRRAKASREIDRVANASDAR